MADSETQFDWTGTSVAGRFRIEALAGSGGAGAVYRARDLQTDAPVALKILHARRDGMLQRFRREASALETLAHDGIVRYVDHGTTPEGDAYLVMEWLDGEDLGKRLVRGSLSVDEALALATRLAGTLAFAHAHGFIHRDIKPENIFLPAGEVSRAKLLDFGLARPEHDAAGPTLQGALLGTPAYMSPEQASGSTSIDARSDVFALGSVLFEALAGRPIFEGSLVHVLSKIVLEDAPRLGTLRADVPQVLEALVARMLARDATARPDANEVVLELSRLRDASALGSPEQHYETRVVRTFRAPRDVVWALLADTNRWDRIAGARPTTYERADTLPGDAPAGSKIGRASLLGMDVGWVEVGEWVEGSFFWGERRFVEGPVPCIGYRIRIHAPTEDVCEAECTVYLAGERLPPADVCEMLRGTFQARLERYLDALERLLDGDQTDDASGGEPPGTRARRILLRAVPDPLLVGRRTVVPDSEFDVRASRFADVPVDARVRDAIVDFLDRRADEEVRQIRAFELARAWSYERRDVLRGFLHAMRAGLTELVWQLMCPTCRVAAGFASRLADAREHAHCATCDAAFDVDFARNVEAVFTIAPAVRALKPAVYCGGSPVFRPHVFAALRAGPSETREEPALVPRGEIVVRRLGTSTRVAVEESESPRAWIEARVDDDGVRVTLSDESAPDGVTRLKIVNESDGHADVLFERALDAADVVTGVAMASVPEFGDLFATDAPAAREELRVGSVCLVGVSVHRPSELFRALGDARAFALVTEMFDAATELLSRDGAIVRTDGESALACFLAPARAVSAAFELTLRAEQIALAHGQQAHALAAAVHEGPALLVGARGRREFFGSTVHTVWSLLARAGAGEVAMSAAVALHPAVSAVAKAWAEGGRCARIEDVDGAGGVQGGAAVRAATGAELRGHHHDHDHDDHHVQRRA